MNEQQSQLIQEKITKLLSTWTTERVLDELDQLLDQQELDM